MKKDYFFNQWIIVAMNLWSMQHDSLLFQEQSKNIYWNNQKPRERELSQERRKLREKKGKNIVVDSKNARKGGTGQRQGKDKV